MLRNDFLIFLLVVFVSFAFVNDSFAEKKIKLRFGQEIDAESLKFTLEDVNDSRCPSDVTCVWQGQVTATILIQNQTHKEMIDLMPGDSYTFFLPYKIILLDVSPYPVSTEKHDDHIATLAMFSTDGTPPCEKHMTVKDGICVPESPTPLDFRESGEGLSLLHTYASLSLVGTVIVFFVIKKLRNRK